jgi:HEAT repeat protein
MGEGKAADSDIRSMIADYMEAGFLENIIDMFRYDKELYALIGELIRDERVRVRIGITALMEDLKIRDGRNIARAIPRLVPLLKHEDPVVRGDTASLLGIIGDKKAIPFLEEALSDENPNVEQLAREALEEIGQKNLRP